MCQCTYADDGVMIIKLQTDDSSVPVRALKFLRGSRWRPHSVTSDGSVAPEKSSALVLKWGGPGVRRKGLPQASPAVWWSVTGSFPLPSGREAALWSVSNSDLPGWKKSAHHFIHYLGAKQKCLIPESRHARLVSPLFSRLQVAD